VKLCYNEHVWTVLGMTDVFLFYMSWSQVKNEQFVWHFFQLQTQDFGGEKRLSNIVA